MSWAVLAIAAQNKSKESLLFCSWAAKALQLQSRGPNSPSPDLQLNLFLGSSKFNSSEAFIYSYLVLFYLEYLFPLFAPFC